MNTKPATVRPAAPVPIAENTIPLTEVQFAAPIDLLTGTPRYINTATMKGWGLALDVRSRDIIISQPGKETLYVPIAGNVRAYRR